MDKIEEIARAIVASFESGSPDIAKNMRMDWQTWMPEARAAYEVMASSDGVPIPRDVTEQVLSMGRAEWGKTDELTAAGHLAHLEETLRITREHFNFEDVPVAMHGLYLEGTGTVLCHTGTSPNSGANAQALAGAWNWLVDQARADHGK